MRPVTLEPDVDRPVVSAELFQRLLEFSEAQAGRDTYEFALTVRDEERRIVGGLCGELIWNSLYVAILWVSESSRGQGHGSALMQTAEDMARARVRSRVPEHHDVSGTELLQEVGVSAHWRVTGLAERVQSGLARQAVGCRARRAA